MDQVMEAGKEKLNLNRSTVDEAFQLSSERKRIDMHIKIAKATLAVIKARKLDEFAAIEEQFIETLTLV